MEEDSNSGTEARARERRRLAAKSEPFRFERTAHYDIRLFEAQGESSYVLMTARTRKTGREVFAFWVRRRAVERETAQGLAAIVGEYRNTGRLPL